MSTRDLSYRASPFAHMVFLVSEALRGPAATSEASADEPRTARDERSWLDRLDAWAWRQHQKEREAYLAQSKDIAELEARLRELERGIASRYY
jgi:hypothetical protein